MKLKIGDKPPIFTLKDYRGLKISLSDYKGKTVFLSFFRTATCPFCNMRVQELIRKEDAFKRNGIEVIAFFHSTKQEIEKYAGKQNPWFPVLPDPESVIYKLYGVEESKGGMLKTMLKPVKMMKMMTSGFFNLKSINATPIVPADFLINDKMKIEKVYYGKDFGDHIDLKEVLK